MLRCSSAFQRVASLMFMAPKLKPQRLHQTAETGAEQLVKKARTMTTESSMKDAFSLYADYLNNFIEPLRLGIESYRRSKVETKGMNFQFGNSDSSSAKSETRERVVKASRDITMNSKKVIFQVHRLSKDNKEEYLEKAGTDLEAVREQHFARLMKELQGTDFWKLRRAYSPGSVQEYVEAATFYKFCLADLTGELMRMAIGSLSDGEVEFAQRICQFVRQIHRELLLVVPQMDDSYDMKSKMEVMLQSVIKIENACFSVHVRGSEYIPLLGDDAPTSFLLGASSLHLELKSMESDDCMRKLSGGRRKCQLWIRRGMVQETENSSGAIGAMLSADAATDCGLRRRMYEETSPEEMNVHMSIRTVPSFLGETDENIFEEICKSGTGKPTVIELLRKFYNPDEVITFDGFEINTFSWNGHRGNPGYDTMMLRQTMWFSIQWTGSWFTHRLSTIKNSFKNGINVEKGKKETLIDIKNGELFYY
ncbi:hypothetical protein HID58_059677 [Brassica napus]|uniref:Translin-associated protein X n=1 Tax=Brassica napus TaxID=3708 RepID=A0ABQ7ZUD4_BRANA|nr:hypothetical protein HID58_059677 [Brassica napus]